MDCATIISEVIDLLKASLWPSATLVIAWRYRDVLAALMSSFRLNDLEISAFGVKIHLKKAEDVAGTLPPSTSTSELTREQQHTNDALIEAAPRAAILDVYAILEQLANDLAKKCCDVSPLHDSFVFLIDVLRQRGIINASTFTLLDELRVIGEGAKRSALGEHFSANDARRYRRLVEIAIQQLRSAIASNSAQ